MLFQGVIYDCMVAICHIPHFRTKVAELGGLSILITAVNLRRNRHKAKRRARLTTTHDEATEKLFLVLRRDISALRIQNIARICAAKRKMNALRQAKGAVYKTTTTTKAKKGR